MVSAWAVHPAPVLRHLRWCQDQFGNGKEQKQELYQRALYVETLHLSFKHSTMIEPLEHLLRFLKMCTLSYRMLMSWEGWSSESLDNTRRLIRLESSGRIDYSIFFSCKTHFSVDLRSAWWAMTVQSSWRTLWRSSTPFKMKISF